MSEDLPDLEPIELSTSEANPPAGTWPPGWYPDPWTAGQYRYWSGQAWTADTNRWGPFGADAGRTPGGAHDVTDPRSSRSTPLSSGYGWATSPLPEVTGDDGSTHRRRGPIVAGVMALVVAVVASGAVGYAIDAHSHGRSAAQTPSNTFPSVPGGSSNTTPTVPGAGISHDRYRQALSALVVRQADVNASRTVSLIPMGNLLTQPTLDLCNGTFPSERLRTARLQVADLDAATGSTTSLSTEAVLYRDAAASSQAFAELRQVSASCPHRPVVSPVGEPPTQTVFNAAPDGAWPHVPGVDRQAYSFISTTVATAGQPSISAPSVAVYLRRGRALLGLYFDLPNGAQSPVAGQRTIEGIVGVFEARMAALPAVVVNGTSLSAASR
jgi:hypothetical protein